MSQPPLMSFHDLRVSFGHRTLFENLTIHVEKRDKICLVGQNGSGKSTLLKILADQIEYEYKRKYLQPGLKIHYLPQDSPTSPAKTLLAYIEQPGVMQHEGLAMLDLLELKPEWEWSSLSGGQRRRAALAKALAGSPDLLLLDEPTNHLDMPVIEWLEDELKSYLGAFIVISHDRTFLKNVSERVLWMDRGILRRLDKGYQFFEEWQEQIWEEERKSAIRLNSKLRAEDDWLHGGVTARRKRNQRRLKLLHKLREEKRSLLLNRPSKTSLPVLSPEVSSKMIIEAEMISKAYGENCLFRSFSTRILRGDRIGIIGPNGSGKTTLVKALIGCLAPDKGTVRLGAKIELVYFDQLRESLNLDQTPWEWLCESGGDHVNVQGHSRHVVAYLKDFLFTDNQAKSLIRTFSGGERNRLALAKALAQQGNLLVLDEPTNDLDMDTLDLLQEMLSDFPGTLIVVSHDRDFLDHVTTSVIALEGHGKITEVIGGYQDYLRQLRKEHPAPKKKSKVVPQMRSVRPPREGLLYKEKIEFEKLPKLIEDLTQRCQDVERRLSEPRIYQNNPQEFLDLSKTLAELKTQLENAEERWLILAEKNG